jgi:hypothetical protein
MASYKITDNVTGKTVTVSGDTAPTEADAEGIFQQAGLRETAAQPKSFQEAFGGRPVPEKAQWNAPQQPNPLLKAAAGVQNFLGQSEALPIAGAIATRAATGVPGLSSFLGASGGERLKQSMAEGGPMAMLKALIPSLEQNPEVRNKVLQSGLVAGGTDLALTGLGKILTPMKTVGNIQKGQIASETTKGTTVSGDKIVESVKNAAKNITPDRETKLAALVEDAVSKYGGKQIPLNDAMEIMRNAGDAYSAAGKVGKTAVAKFQNAIFSGIRSQLPSNINTTQKFMSFLYKAPKALRSAAYIAGIPAAIYYGLKGAKGLAGGTGE